MGVVYTAIIASTCIIRCCYSMARRAIWYVRYCGPATRGRPPTRWRFSNGWWPGCARFWDPKFAHVVGFARNSRLAATVEPLVEQVQADYDDSGEKQRQFTELVYQADSWDRERRMASKVEVSERGFNPLCGHQQDLTAGQLTTTSDGASARTS